jgi:hypothetical protein
MYIRVIGCDFGVDSSGSKQRLVAGSCENGNEPLNSIKQRLFFLAELLLDSHEGLCTMTVRFENKYFEQENTKLEGRQLKHF